MLDVEYRLLGNLTGSLTLLYGVQRLGTETCILSMWY